MWNYFTLTCMTCMFALSLVAELIEIGLAISSQTLFEQFFPIRKCFVSEMKRANVSEPIGWGKGNRRKECHKSSAYSLEQVFFFLLLRLLHIWAVRQQQQRRRRWRRRQQWQRLNATTTSTTRTRTTKQQQTATKQLSRSRTNNATDSQSIKSLNRHQYSEFSRPKCVTKSNEWKKEQKKKETFTHTHAHTLAANMCVSVYRNTKPYRIITLIQSNMRRKLSNFYSTIKAVWECVARILGDFHTRL